MFNSVHLVPSANAALPPHPRLQTFYLPSAHFASSPSVPSPPSHVHGCFSIAPASSSPFDSLRVLQRNARSLREGALNYYTLSRVILLTLKVSKNLTLTHLPLSGSLDFLLCDQIVPTPGLAFSLLMPRALAAAPSFSPGRAYPSLNFLSPLFLSFFTCPLL